MADQGKQSDIFCGTFTDRNKYDLKKRPRPQKFNSVDYWYWDHNYEYAGNC